MLIFSCYLFYVYMSWGCLIGGSSDDWIHDILPIDNRVYFCGDTQSFDRVKRGFVGCLHEGRLEWFKVVREASSAYRLCLFNGKLAVCGKDFLGFFDLDTGRIQWVKKGKFNDMCSYSGKLILAGSGGEFAIVSDSGVVAEKRIKVLRRRGEWPWLDIRGVCCADSGYVLAGESCRLLSSERDCVICLLDSSLEPKWSVGFSGSLRDCLHSAYCDLSRIYVCGETFSISFSRRDIFVGSFSEKGELEWIRVYSSSEDDIARSIVADNKYLYVVGSTGSDGSILVLDKYSGDIIEGYLVKDTCLNSIYLTSSGFLLGGCTWRGFGGWTSLLVHLSEGYSSSEIRISGQRLTIGEWIPKIYEWRPTIVRLESKAVKLINKKVLEESEFSVFNWTPQIICSDRYSLTKHVAKPATLLIEPFTAKTTPLNYLNLLSSQLDLVEELSVDWSNDFSFECGLSRFSGVWRCVRLGCGGWGCAYLAKQNKRKVVFKVPRGYESIIEEGEYPTVNLKLMKRIVSEAEVIKKLDHSNILKLLDYSSEYPLLVYEYADYGSLEYQLREGWVPLFREVILLGIQIGDALRYIHSRGLVHCDIKPSNIFFVNRVAKIGDFSALVKLLSRTSNYSKFTYTPGFAAPEQRYSDLRRKVIELGYENRIDVYQLGNLLLYLLTGESIDGEDISDEKLVKDVVNQVEDSNLRKIISSALRKYAWERPGADEIVRYLVSIYRKHFK